MVFGKPLLSLCKGTDEDQWNHPNFAAKTMVTGDHSICMSWNATKDNEH